MQSGVRVLLSRSDQARPLIARAGPGGDEELTGAFGEPRHRRERHASGLCRVCELFALAADQADDHVERLFDRGAGRRRGDRLSRYRVLARLSDRGRAGPATWPCTLISPPPPRGALPRCQRLRTATSPAHSAAAW